MIDRNPHPSVQPWSRGPIFPAVIARIEDRMPVGYFTLVTTEWELTYPGQEPQRYHTYEDAEQQARGLNRAAAMARGVNRPKNFTAPEITARAAEAEKVLKAYRKAYSEAYLDLLKQEAITSIDPMGHSEYYYDVNRNRAPDTIRQEFRLGGTVTGRNPPTYMPPMHALPADDRRMQRRRPGDGDPMIGRRLTADRREKIGTKADRVAKPVIDLRGARAVFPYVRSWYVAPDRFASPRGVKNGGAY